MILLVAGLLLGGKAWLAASGRADLPAPEAGRHDFFHNPDPLSDRDAIPAKMRPFFFLPVSINTADSQLLETVPGIGPRLADRIIALRSTRNGFRDVAELLDVEGIGPRKFAAIRQYCSL
jgi:competence protein ComEA